MNKRQIFTSFKIRILFLLILFPFIICAKNILLTSSFPLEISESQSSIKNDSKIIAQLNIIDEIKFGDSLDNEFPLPKNGFLDGSDYNIFWWVHICDTQNVWLNWEQTELNTARINNLKLMLNDTRDIIQPLFIANTGDLVDSDYTKFMISNTGQIPWEWSIYNQTIREAGWNSTNYFDILGNHDVYSDPGNVYFMNYSISGNAFKTQQYSVTYSLPFGNYSFIYLATPEDLGLEYPFAMGGRLNSSEMKFFETELKKNVNANVTFGLAHHPIFEIFSDLSSEGLNHIGLAKKYGLDYWACGHGHADSYQKVDGIASVETAQFKKDDGSYRIVAVDNDGISSSIQKGHGFPIGMITNPIDEKFAIGDYDMEKHKDPKKIRALAWDKVTIDSLKWRSDNGNWIDMDYIEGPLWEAEWDSNLVNAQEHKIEINITNINGDSKIESILYKSTYASFFGWEQGIPIIIASFIGLVVVLPISIKLIRKRNPEKLKQKREDKVDPKQMKYLIIKFISLLILPMTFAPILMNRIVSIHSLFIISEYGFLYSDTIMFFFAAIVAFGIFPQSLNLSKSHRGRIFFWSIMSLAFEGFLLTFYFLHFGAWALLSIGYYVCILCDILIMRRAIQMHKERS